VQATLAVVERIIKMCSNPGELVLDPLAGTGKSCVAAAALGRRYLGSSCAKRAGKARSRCG
jgi:DNA modification methylase